MKISRQLKLGVAGVLFLGIFAFNLAVATKAAKNFFYFISSPLQKSFLRGGNGASKLFSEIKDTRNLRRENNELIQKNQELLSENVLLKEFKKESEILSVAFSQGILNEFKLETADIISKDQSQDYILVNKGNNADIQRGMPVLGPNKIVLGRISEVFADSSKVLLISDKASSFNAKIAGTNSAGIVKGQGNLSIIFDLVPQDMEMKEGDAIATVSFGGVFPKGLLVGQIEKIDKSDVRPYQTAKISPALKLSSLETVFIITDF